MQLSYSKNYVSIYFWQGLSILLGFLSLFVIVPYLSSDKSLYGVYSVCISVTVFLSYADLGFLSAGQKYASEAYSRDESDQEIRLIGFSHFILLFFVLLIAGFFLYLSFSPEILIKDIQPGEQTQISSSLLQILAIFAPVIVIQRTLQTIFSIRLQEYKLQRLTILGNLLKISSVFWFFRQNSYNLVSYFFFVQVVNLLVSLIGIMLAKKLFHYNFISLFSHFRFDKTIFKQTKGLAFSSVFVTLSWILYYEIDSFVIGRMFGASQVAIYAIGFTVLTFFRSVFGVVFSPFSARFNHFIGQGQMEQLQVFYKQVISLTFPIVVLPIIAVEVFANPIVMTWVGSDYSASIPIMRWLVLCNFLAFISYPAGMLLIALKKIKSIYLVNLLMPIIYWGGIWMTYKIWGLESFAIFKFLAFTLSGFIYINVTLKFLGISFMEYLRKLVYPYLFSLSVFVVLLLLGDSLFIEEKNKLNLLYNGMYISFCFCIAFFVSYLTVSGLRGYVNYLIGAFKNKLN